MPSLLGSRRVISLAFTLIELLVVVAIIGLLLGILLPALNDARKQSKQILCLTHLRSIGQAANVYAGENDGWLVANESQEQRWPLPGRPEGYPRDDSFAHTQFAISLLNGALYDHSVHGRYDSRNQQAMMEICAGVPVFQCPSHPVPQQGLDYIVNAFVQPYTQRNADNDRGQMQPHSGSGSRGERPVLDIAFFHRLSSFRQSPAKLIYVTEGHASLPDGSLEQHDIFYASQLPFASWPRIANDRRHPGGINNVFFDGHARTMSLMQVDPGWPKSLGIRLERFTYAPEAER